MSDLIMEFKASASGCCGVDGWIQHAMAIALRAPISRAVDGVLFAVAVPRTVGQESLRVGLSECWVE